MTRTAGRGLPGFFAAVERGHAASSAPGSLAGRWGGLGSLAGRWGGLGSPARRWGGLGPLARHWGALGALALFLAAGLAVLDDYGITVDEYIQRGFAARNIEWVAGKIAFTTLGHDKFYGTAFEIPLSLGERAFGLEGSRSVYEGSRGVYLFRHLVTHLFFLTGGLFAYLLALRLFGSRVLALLAMGLFLAHPRLYAHSFFNTKDIPFLVAFMGALFLAQRAFKRDTISAFVLLGVGVGALVNLRIMGVVLLAGVPALRAAGLALAPGRAERKRILLTTGAFALAGGLAVYGLSPYLWADPIVRAVEWWTTLAHHPTNQIEPFRGTLYPSADFPPEYLPHWFSITSPPFALLLGAVGAGGVLVLAARAPRKALRSARLRFGALAVGCFAAPILAVILLDADMYMGWRQAYYLWAPFSTLGAFGLAFLASEGRRFRLRAAVYGAAGAGLAASVISMALIHPNQQVYFNFLVDRVAPEHLGSQYVMDYWGHSTRQGFEWILNERPDEKIEATAASPFAQLEGNAEMLPLAQRERLTLYPGKDAVAIRHGAWGRADVTLHRVKVYNNTIASVVWNDWDALREAALRREPALESVYDFHFVDGDLALVKEPCAPSFLTKQIPNLRVIPADRDDLPYWREAQGFDLFRFRLGTFGAYFDGKCVARLPLPSYAIAGFEVSWSSPLLDEAEARERARRARSDGQLLARSGYDLYLADGELVYLRDSCDPLETERSFHLNVHPENASDLPEDRRERGHERFHFEFHLNGAFADGGCAVFFPLPDYPAAGIQTGQHDGEGRDLWFAEFLIDPERRWADAAAGASGEPAARGGFDVYLADGALAYVKEPCEPADTEAPFFLHVTPERADDLPEERRGFGFDNLDFAFFPNGALFEGRCAARAALPEYPIASIRTGQHGSGVGEIWGAEFTVGR